MKTIPISYYPGFLTKSNADGMLASLTENLDWIRHDKTPRSEYYTNLAGVPYTYGTPPFDRTYQPQPASAHLEILRDLVQRAAGCKFEVCFLNRYHDQSDQLGWHSDDSPEMDDERPIAIVSLGVEREIMFREIPKIYAPPRSVEPTPVVKLKLEHGSLCLMRPGMQDTHQHRIPKAGFTCGERISLTFRGYAGTKP